MDKPAFQVWRKVGLDSWLSWRVSGYRKMSDFQKKHRYKAEATVRTHVCGVSEDTDALSEVARLTYEYSVNTESFEGESVWEDPEHRNTYDIDDKIVIRCDPRLLGHSYFPERQDLDAPFIFALVLGAAAIVAFLLMLASEGSSRYLQSPFAAVQPESLRSRIRSLKLTVWSLSNATGSSQAASQARIPSLMDWVRRRRSVACSQTTYVQDSDRGNRLKASTAERFVQ